MRGRKLLPDKKQLWVDPVTLGAGLSIACELINAPVPTISTAARETGCARGKKLANHPKTDKLV